MCLHYLVKLSARVLSPYITYFSIQVVDFWHQIFTDCWNNSFQQSTTVPSWYWYTLYILCQWWRQCDVFLQVCRQQNNNAIFIFLRESHQYGATRLMKMFPNKRWTLGGLKTFLKNIDSCSTWNVALEAVDRCLSVFLSCLSVTLVYCGQTVWWIKMNLGVQVGLSPGHIVLDGDPAQPPPKGHSLPKFSAHICCSLSDY